MPKRQPKNAGGPRGVCPGCGTTQPDRGVNAIYWCEHCRCQFDGDPGEDGDWSDWNPAARLERAKRGLRRA